MRKIPNELRSQKRNASRSLPVTFFGVLFSFARYEALNLEKLAFSEKLSRPRKKRKRVWGENGSHPRSQGLTADTALPKALAKTKTGTSKIL
jgi:hypothetical protein